MNNTSVNVSTNWSHIGGCMFSQCVQVQAGNAENLNRPLLEELVKEEKAILLSQGHCLKNCELYVKILSNYQIQTVSFVCNVKKIEIFQGEIAEYLETIYGIIVDASDNQFQTYRYDIDVVKLSIADLTLRFLTDSSDVCIFGIMLQTILKPHCKAIVIPNRGCINFQPIFQKPSKSLGQASERSKQLLELLSKTNQSNSLTLEQVLRQNMNISNGKEIASEDDTTNANILNHLKLYINDSFRQMELRIMRHLECMEQRQSQKLDAILTRLDKIKK